LRHGMSPERLTRFIGKLNYDIGDIAEEYHRLAAELALEKLEKLKVFLQHIDRLKRVYS